MFMPMASPVSYENRRYRLLPEANALTFSSLPCLVVLSAAALISSKWSSTQHATWAQCLTPSVRKTGARVISSLTMTTSAPPADEMTLQPRETDASSAPSVVAMGTRNSPLAWLPLIRIGPTKPSGIWTHPIMFSMFFSATIGSNEQCDTAFSLAPVNSSAA